MPTYRIIRTLEEYADIETNDDIDRVKRLAATVQAGHARLTWEPHYPKHEPPYRVIELEEEAPMR